MMNIKNINEAAGETDPANAAVSTGSRSVRALIVEDNGFDRRRLTHAAREAGLNMDFSEAATCAEAEMLLETEKFGLCIFDYNLPDGDGIALARARVSYPKNALAPVIIVAGKGEAAIAVEAMHSGCADYLLKDSLTSDALKRSVINALEKSRLTEERDSAKAEGEMLRTVLERFSRDCVTELRPTVTRMLRLIRNMTCETRDPRLADKLRELESSGTLLFGFLQEIERYASELPDQYLSGKQGESKSPRLAEVTQP